MPQNQAISQSNQPKNEQTAAKAELEAIQKSIEDATNELDGVRLVLNATKQDLIATRNEKSNVLAKKAQEIDAQVQAELENRLKERDETIAQYESEARTARKQTELAQETLKSLKATISTHESTISNLQAQEHELHKSVSKITAGLEEAQRNVSALNRQKIDLLEEESTLVASKEQLGTDIRSAEGKLTLLKTDIHKNEQEQASIKSNLLILDDQHRKLTMEIEANRANYEKSMEDIAHRFQDLDKREQALQVREEVLAQKEKRVQNYARITGL
jgi:chromosome segregation ATPase